MKKIAFILIIYFNSILTGQVDYKDFETYVERAIDSLNAEGLAIAVVKDNKIVYTQAFGYADKDNKVKLTTNSLFNIASASKAFTAALTVKLAEESKLSLDDKVKNYIPYFELNDVWISSQINITDLLSHRSGLKTFAGDLLWYHTDYSNKEIISRMKHIPVENEFRTEFGYQNNMYMIASEIISDISGIPWYRYLEEEIFIKLDMFDTKVSSSYLTDNDDIAFPHVNGKKYPLSNEKPNAAGSIFSNVNDMANWLLMLLNKGEYNDQQVLSEKSIDEMFTPRILLKPGRTISKMGANFHAYGLGWFMFDYNGRKIVYHDGGMPGYLARVLLVPKENMGVVILTNGLNPLTSALSLQLVDQYFGDKQADWVSDYIQRVKFYESRKHEKNEVRAGSKIEDTVPSISLEKYAGKYNDPSYGEAVISFDNNKLFMELPAKDVFVGELQHWHYDTFKIRFKDEYLPEGFVTFNFNSRREVIGFNIDLTNPDFNFNDLNFVRIEDADN